MGWPWRPALALVLLQLSWPWWTLLVVQGRSQNALVGQVRLECVEDVKLLVRPQRQKLLNQFARVWAPTTEPEASLSRGQLLCWPSYPWGTLIPEFTISGGRETSEDR